MASAEPIPASSNNSSKNIDDALLRIVNMSVSVNPPYGIIMSRGRNHDFSSIDECGSGRGARHRR
jgi:hypothetical protein